MDSTYCEKGAYCQDHTANQENLMDTNNWRSTPPSGEPTMDTGDWRTQLQPDSRQRIVNKIMDTLKRHLPFSGLEGLNELRKIAVRFEEKIFTAARSQPDYLRRISLKMLTMETKSQNTIPYTGNNSNSPDLGSQGLQNQVHSQGQSIHIPLQSNQSQARQQLLPQNVPNNMATAGVQSSAGLQSGMPSVSGLTQNPMPNVVGQNSNMQSMSGISQNLLGQGMPSNIFANQQRQMQERQQMLPQQKQQQHLYHQQLQQQLMKQKIQQGNLQPSLMQPHMQQQNLLPPAQLRSSQQSASLDSTAQTGHANGGDWQEEVYQKIKTMKETYLPELNEVYQKIAAKLQQHDSLPQQPKSEQLEKLKIFKTMLERIITFLSVSKANILPSFKDTLSSYEKQIMNFINANRPRKSISALQQGQLPPPRMHSMQQPQPQINQTESYDSQMNPQLQSINLQGSVPTMQSNNVTSLQHNSLASLPWVSTAQQTMLNSLQPGSNLDSGQASLDSTAPTGHANAGDWQEEAYQNIKTMKETYLPELNEMYQKIAAKLQQHDSLPQRPKSEQLEKLKIFKTMLERIITFLSVSKANILPAFKDKLSSYEKQIMNFINANRPRKSVSALQQGQLPLPHMHSMQQPQLQINQTQSYDSQMNPQLQSINLQGSVPTMQSNNMTSLQHSSSSLPGVSTAQQNMLNSLQPGSNLDSDEQSKPGAQFLTSSPPLFRAPFVPSTSTLLTPSPKPGCSEKPIYGPSSLSNYRNISHQQATGEQARSECPVPDTPGNGMSTPLLLAGFENGNDTHGNALITDFGKSNVEEQRHDPRFIMAKPMSLKSLSASVVTMVDEAGAAVGEDLAAMRKRGLHARNFFTLAGMTGADKMRCYMSAIVILVLLFWCIFILHHQN